MIKMKIKNSPASGFAEDLQGFLKLLEDMENKGETVRNESGERKGLFGSKAAYRYTVRLGIEKNSLLQKMNADDQIRQKVRRMTEVKKEHTKSMEKLPVDKDIKKGTAGGVYNG